MKVLDIINTMIDSQIYKLPVRIYKPINYEKFHFLYIFKEGGWVFSDLDSSHYISREANCIVLSVVYRVAPECIYPISLEDRYTAVKWAYRNLKVTFQLVGKAQVLI
ncbi:TPA: alpha/beta hydrolase fold domain-containing protein [Bacillus thuringiensis]|nr:alpha/beta hydrolase fold domain-containing protein [Bacillus thuringiensis]